VLARAAASSGGWWTRRRILRTGLAAAVVLVMGVTWLFVGTRERDPGIDDDYVQTMHALGGTALRAAPLAGPLGISWGQAFVFEGKTSWVFVSMSWDVPNGTYHVVLDRSDGPSATVAPLHVIRGARAASA
jgi:hypothetical protein